MKWIIDLAIWLLCCAILHWVLKEPLGEKASSVALAIMLCTTIYAKVEAKLHT